MTTPEVDVPVVGRVPKGAVIAAGGLVVGLVGYAYYKQRQSAAAAAAAPTDPGYVDPGTLPVVPGAAQGGYGIGNTGNPTTGNPDAILTNDQWVQAVRDRLAGTYDDLAIVTACGLFLDKKPLSQTNQAIIQAALAVAGYPPVGDYHIIATGGAGVPLLVAPAGVAVSGITDSGGVLTWSGVPGASSYNVYAGANKVVNTGMTRAVIGGWPHATSIGPFTVAGVALGGTEGPHSAGVSWTTLAAPTPASGATPSPVPNPMPNPTRLPGPPPVQHRYPEWHFSHTNQAGDSYATIAAANHLNMTGSDLYAYQFTPQAGRPAATLQILRQRGQNLIFPAGETEVPYPR